MMNSFREDRDKKEQATRLSYLEGDLRTILQPVKPRPSYIYESRTRLIKATQREGTRFLSLQLLIMALAGLAGGVFILMLSVRTTVTLLSTLGLIHLAREQARRKRIVSMARLAVNPASTGGLPAQRRRIV